MTAISKTLVTVELANGGWAGQELDTIAHEGGMWLVPHWTISSDGRSRRPLRMVAMAMADTGEACPDADAFTGFPIPESILSDGHVPLSRARLFLVVESPDVWVGV